MCQDCPHYESYRTAMRFFAESLLHINIRQDKISSYFDTQQGERPRWSKVARQCVLLYFLVAVLASRGATKPFESITPAKQDYNIDRWIKRDNRLKEYRSARAKKLLLAFNIAENLNQQEQYTLTEPIRPNTRLFLPPVEWLNATATLKSLDGRATIFEVRQDTNLDKVLKIRRNRLYFQRPTEIQALNRHVRLEDLKQGTRLLTEHDKWTPMLQQPTPQKTRRPLLSVAPQVTSTPKATVTKAAAQIASNNKKSRPEPPRNLPLWLRVLAGLLIGSLLLTLLLRKRGKNFRAARSGNASPFVSVFTQLKNLGQLIRNKLMGKADILSTKKFLDKFDALKIEWSHYKGANFWHYCELRCQVIDRLGQLERNQELTAIEIQPGDLPHIVCTFKLHHEFVETTTPKVLYLSVVKGNKEISRETILIGRERTATDCRASLEKLLAWSEESQAYCEQYFKDHPNIAEPLKRFSPFEKQNNLLGINFGANTAPPPPVENTDAYGQPHSLSEDTSTVNTPVEIGGPSAAANLLPESPTSSESFSPVPPTVGEKFAAVEAPPVDEKAFVKEQSPSVAALSIAQAPAVDKKSFVAEQSPSAEAPPIDEKPFGNERSVEVRPRVVESAPDVDVRSPLGPTKKIDSSDQLNLTALMPVAPSLAAFAGEVVHLREWLGEQLPQVEDKLQFFKGFYKTKGNKDKRLLNALEEFAFLTFPEKSLPLSASTHPKVALALYELRTMQIQIIELLAESGYRAVAPKVGDPVDMGSKEYEPSGTPTPDMSKHLRIAQVESYAYILEEPNSTPKVLREGRVKFYYYFEQPVETTAVTRTGSVPVEPPPVSSTPVAPPAVDPIPESLEVPEVNSAATLPDAMQETIPLAQNAASLEPDNGEGLEKRPVKVSYTEDPPLRGAPLYVEVTADWLQENEPYKIFIWWGNALPMELKGGKVNTSGTLKVERYVVPLDIPVHVEELWWRVKDSSGYLWGEASLPLEKS